MNKTEIRYWKPISTAPCDELVETKIDDEKGERNFQIMTKSGNFWCSGDMYVYYTPTHWRPCE